MPINYDLDTLHSHVVSINYTTPDRKSMYLEFLRHCYMLMLNINWDTRW
ncbi:hypothetical protein MtrunA17_Chr7g0270151 [Medicago truncatula]|uniref:Uncharacterized protein n=1 Tax=Medicago truncatula TaxID=3880 RepID=A0A396HB61_MEDTR|nr:hypothetical protein MtrunA17_Chr7g0270151 [Medicago truncatula]